MDNKIPHIYASVDFRSNLSLEEVSKIISEKIFANLPFEGKEFKIYDEVPAVYIRQEIIGLKVILSGYSGFENEYGYSLEIIRSFASNIPSYELSLNDYLMILMKEQLKGESEIHFA